MNKENEITLTMTKKQLDYIIYTMYVALDSDCKAMNKLGDNKIKKIITLYEALYDMAGQNKSK